MNERTRDGLGRPIQSGRAVVLNSADYSDLSPAYDFVRPWDVPANRSVAAIFGRTFLCRNTQGYDAPRSTNHAAIVDGDECSLDLCGPGVPRGARPVEVPESTIARAEPLDVSSSEIVNDAMARDPGGFVVIGSDGKVRRLSREEILDGWSRGKAAFRAAKSPGR